MVLRNLVLRGADAFVAISTPIQQEMVAAGAAADHVVLIPHGVDTRRFRPAEPQEKMDLRRRLGLPEGGELVVFTGRLLRGKGIEVLLDAFERMVEARREARLVLVGDGGGQQLSVEGALRARVAAGALAARVSFTGRVENVDDYLRAADVFAFPSFFEAMPLSVLEATSCGLACVASAVGGIVDVIEDGRSGLLLPPGDVDALTRALTSLLGDAVKRSALGTAARERAVRLFDFDATVERYAALFEGLVATRRAA
jgi:glycosyltransferase involved in cell wall biosynthesis